MIKVITTKFGEQLTARRISEFSFKPTWGISTLRYTTTLSGTGSAAIQEGGEFKLSSGTALNSSSTVNTNRRGQYKPGAQCQFGIGVRIPVLPTGSQVIEWGYTDFQNGFGYGVDATGIYVFIYKNSVREKIYQDDWNGDKLDTTGINRLRLNLEAGNISQCDFVWYGYGEIAWSFYIWNPVLKINERKLIHTYRVLESISIIDPNQPLLFRIQNGDSSDTNLDLFIGGHQFSVIDGDINLIERQTTQILESFTTAGNTNWQPLIVLRKKAEFPTGRANSVNVFLKRATVASNTDVRVRITIGGVTTGAYSAVTDTPITETAMEQKIASAVTIGVTSSGIPIMYDYAIGNTSRTASFTRNEFDNPVGGVQELILWIKRLSSTGTVVINQASMTVSEEW